MSLHKNCITLKNAYCKNIISGGVRDLKSWEGSSKAEACQNRCNKGKLLTRGGEYQKLDYNCGGSFIYKKNGKSRCYHCGDIKGEIRLNSATNNLQMCIPPECDEKIKPDQCNWDMLSDDYKSQYTLKTSCTWNDLSDDKRKTANDAAKEGMITPNMCTWNNLSQDKRNAANNAAKEGMILPNQCNWEDLSDVKKTTANDAAKRTCSWQNLSLDKKNAANDAAKRGMILPNQCNWEDLSDEKKTTANDAAKRTCSWQNLSLDKKIAENKRQLEGMIVPLQCEWNMLADHNKEAAKDILKGEGMITRDMCNWNDLDLNKKNAANVRARDGMVTYDQCRCNLDNLPSRDLQQIQTSARLMCEWNNLPLSVKKREEERIKAGMINPQDCKWDNLPSNIQNGYVQKNTCRYQDLSAAERGNCKMSDIPCIQGNLVKHAWRWHFRCGKSYGSAKCPRYKNGDPAYCNKDGFCGSEPTGSNAEYKSDDSMCAQMYDGCALKCCENSTCKTKG